MKRMVVIILVLAAVILLKYPPKFLFESANLADEYFPAKENADGTLDYVIGLRVKKEHEGNYWVLRFPNTQYVETPKRGNSVDVQLPNGVDYKLTRFPNDSLVLYFKLPEWTPMLVGADLGSLPAENHLELQLHHSSANFERTSEFFFDNDLQGCIPAGKLGAQVDLYKVDSKFKVGLNNNYCFVINAAQTGYSIMTTDGKHLASVTCWDSGLGICSGSLEVRSINRSVTFNFPAKGVQKTDYIKLVNFISDYVSKATVRIEIVPPGKLFQWEVKPK